MSHGYGKMSHGSWVNVAMGICRMGICRLTVYKRLNNSITHNNIQLCRSINNLIHRFCARVARGGRLITDCALCGQFPCELVDEDVSFFNLN